MKKRILSIMLALCMVLAFVPTMAFAEAAGGAATVETGRPYDALEGTDGNKGEGYEKFVDGDFSTKWCVNDFSGAYIIFKTSSAVKINGYSITTGNDNSSYFGRNPKKWTLYGSNEENPSKESTNWEVIDSIADDKVLQDKNNETYYFTLEDTTEAYQYYKLEIYATKGADIMQMSEFALIYCEHNWDTPAVTPATCAERGYSTYQCNICSAVVMKDFTDPLGHDFTGENGKCAVCDQTKAELYTFDVSEGKVRIRDDENIDGKIEVLYGNGQSEGNIDPNETITVTGSTTEHELHVLTARKVTIKVDNLSIDSSNGSNGKYAMLIEGSKNSADVTLILEGVNTFKGGQDRSGITVGEGRKLTIEGSGSLNAQGGLFAAGIGGDSDSSGGFITINGGTVTANGGVKGGAGIGGGFRGSGGTITINGGTVTARGVAGIGGGFGGSGGTFSTDTNGNAIIFAKSISDKSNQSSWSGVIFEGDNGAVYGTSVTPTENFTIESGKTLTTPAGVTLTNNGTIENNGIIYVDGALNGTPTGSGTVFYLLNVANATADGDISEYNSKTYATAGSTITLTPYNPPAGKVFKKWVVSSNNVTVENNTFTMPSAAVTVTAQWRPIYYPITQKPTIQDGEGVKVTLSADGKVAAITVDDGYELNDVVLNGVSLGKVTEVKNLKTGDKLVVTAAKKAAEPTEPAKEEILAALAEQKLAARSALVTMKNGKKAVKITWYNKNGELMAFNGIEIFRSTKRNSGYGKKPIYTTNKNAYYNTAVKKGTKYYYKVRGFVIIDGKKYYTDYSLKAVRTVK